MHKLEIANYAWSKMKNRSYEPTIIEQIFQETFSYLSNAEKTVYIVELLNGLFQYDVPCEYICDIFCELMKIDGYKRENVKEVKIKNSTVLECTGSGKKPFKTLNVSTPSIITAVALGAKIVKKGSGATSSIIGSSDLIYGLGYNKELTVDDSIELLKKCGFAFVDIESTIPRFNALYSGNFFKPHLLSLVLAACVTTIRGNKIVYGLSDCNVEKSCRTIELLKRDEQITVFSSIQDNNTCYDELIGNGMAIVSRFDGRKRTFCNISLDLPKPQKIPAKGTRDESIKEVVSLFKRHENYDYLKIVSSNTAFYLREANIVNDMREGIELAEECIKSDKAYKKLIEIIKVSGGEPSWI